MKKIRVAINGFGRIGRMATRIILQDERIELVAINDLYDASTMAHLFRYDSVHGRFNGIVSATPDAFVIDGHKIHYSSISSVEELPWKKYDIDVLIEATGTCKKYADCQRHLEAGAHHQMMSR
jgi:glyceraldehyde 3-phosphate dehydrogenase